MISKRLITLLSIAALLSACGKEPEPRSVSEFVADPILLEAALLRCTQKRAESRYDPECINVREAVKRVAAENEMARRSELEQQSERKREALRRTQQAAAEARRRALEEKKRREEAEYLAQFGEVPPLASESEDVLSGNQPGAVLMPAAPEEAAPSRSEVPYSAVGSNAPGAARSPLGADADSRPAERPAEEIAQVPAPAPEPQPEPAPVVDEPAPDLGSIRDELRRRNEQTGDDAQAGDDAQGSSNP